MVGYGQENDEKKPLNEILLQLEKKYELRFSYSPEDINNIKIIPPPPHITSEEVMVYLQKNTPLEFSQIDERYISVIRRKNKETLCGTVINAYTGEVLSGANISTLKGSYHTITNAEGVFYIPDNLKQETLHISYIGYESLTAEASILNNECLPVLLTRSVDKLDAVILTGYLTKGIKKQYNGSTVLDSKNFGLLPGQTENDVLQLIQALPGVESVDETVSNLNIRGGSHNENLFLWNDIRVFQNSHFFGLISAFNPELTQKVTLYKNGTNSRYGESTSSVIAMESRKEISDSISGMAGVNLINASANLYLPVSKNFGIELAIRKSLTNLFTSSLYHTFTDRLFQNTEVDNLQNGNSTVIKTEDDFSFIDFSSNILWDLSKKDKLRAYFMIIENALYLTETNPENNQSILNELEKESYILGTSWEHTWSSKLITNAFIYKSEYTLHGNNDNLFSSQKKFQRNGIIETGVKLDATFKPSKNIAWQGGYQFFETGVSNTQDINIPRFLFHEKKVLRTHVSFLSFNYQSPNRKTILNAGARANYYSKFNTLLVEPRLSLFYKLGAGFSIESQAELKSQTLTQRIDFEDDFLGIEKRRWVLVDNEETPIIKSKQASLGIIYKKNGWFINAEGFIKEVLDITTKEQGFQNQFQFINTRGDYIARGFELVLNKKTDLFSAWVSYVTMKNEYEFYALTPSYFPNNNDIRQSATIAGSFTYKHFKLATGLSWHTGKPYTGLVLNEEVIVENGEDMLHFDNPNAKRLPDYYRVNLSAEYVWRFSKRGRLQANASLLNVLNTKNILDINYRLTQDSEGNSIASKIVEHSLGFSPNFSLKILF